MKKMLALVSAVCVVLVLAVSASGSGSYEIFTYATGTNGVGGTYTSGWAAREFNRVYHRLDFTWDLRYCHTDGTCTSWYGGYANPLYDPRTDGYAQAQCYNANDNSGTTWTCQTTRPTTSMQTESGGSAPTSSVSAASSMSALGTTPLVALPAALGNASAAVNQPAGSAVPQNQTVGTIDPSRVHLLLSGVGSRAVYVYAGVTSSGQVCSFETNGGGGCVEQFNDAMPVIWDYEISPAGTWTHITGLAPDRVRGIAVDEAGGTEEQAILRNNAFYIEPTRNPKALVVTYDDGTTQTLPVAGPPPA